MPNLPCYDCKYCGYKTRLITFLLKHYRFEHSSDPNFIVECVFPHCLKSYNNVESLRKHIQRHHKTGEITVLKNTTVESLEHVEDIESDSEECLEGAVGNLDTEPFRVCERIHPTAPTFQQTLVNFLLKLRVKNYVSEKSSELVINKFEEIVDLVLEQTEKNAIECIDTPVSPEAVKVLCRPLFNLKDSLNNLNSAQKICNLFNEHPFVAPEQIVQGASDKFVYIPILKTLLSLLQHEDILTHIFKERKECENIVSDFYSASKFKTETHFTNVYSIQIILYVDDFCLTNPLGTSAIQHKICAVYFSLANIPRHLRSKLYTIQLACLIPSSHIKKYGFTNILSKLVDDIKYLETVGLEVSTYIGKIKVFGTVSALVADNLAAHDIAGFTTSFSGLRRCRFCNANTNNIQNTFCESSFELRTENAHNEQVKIVANNPDLASLYGVKYDSVLNQLHYFHIIWGSPSDIAHDVFEGFCNDLLKLVIEHCLHEKNFDIDFLNQRISNFNYSGRELRNKPSLLSVRNSQITVKQTAAECHNLVRLLPLYVGHKVPVGDSYWRAYTDFLNCLDYILAPSLNIGHINHMRDIIVDFLTSYKNLSDAVHIKPKGHYLVHYSSQYKRFGPLIDYSTLRFEGKHSNLKSIFGTCKNFRNPCLTIATRHQYLQKLYHLNEEYLIEEKTDFKKKSADTLISILDKDLRRQLNLVDCESDSITLLTTVEYNGITYSKGSAVVLDCTDETISFALIENITYVKGSIYFILFDLNILEFSEHLHAYVLMKTDNFLLKKIDDLISSYPLSVYTSETGDKVIFLHHFIRPL